MVCWLRQLPRSFSFENLRSVEKFSLKRARVSTVVTTNSRIILKVLLCLSIPSFMFVQYFAISLTSVHKSGYSYRHSFHTLSWTLVDSRGSVFVKFVYFAMLAPKWSAIPCTWRVRTSPLRITVLWWNWWLYKFLLYFTFSTTLARSRSNLTECPISI